MLRKTLFLFLTFALFALPGQASAATLFEDSFDSDQEDFAIFFTEGTWKSHYDEDPWRTDLNGGVCSKRDDGCNCQGGQGSCGFTVYTNGNGSDPYDNHITHSPEATWTDYEYAVRFSNADNDTIGVIFRYNNTANFYVVLMTRDRFPGPNGCDQFFPPTTQIVKVVGGNRTVLAETDETYEQFAEHQLNIVAIGPAMQVYLDGKLLLEATDDGEDAMLEGGIGLLMIQNGADEDACADGGCWFDDVLVSEFEEESDLDKDGLPDEEDNCPKVFNSEQLDYDQDGLGDACDGDDDNDGVPDSLDNCPLLADASPADFDGDGIGDDCDEDDDNDGLPDALELGEQGDQDPDTTTDPYNPDTDEDGIPDGEEDANQNGKVDEGETDPLVDDADVPPVDEGGEDAGSEPDTATEEDATEEDSGGPEDTGSDEDTSAAEDTGGEADTGAEADSTESDAGGSTDAGSSNTDTGQGNLDPQPGNETIVFGEPDSGCNAAEPANSSPIGMALLAFLLLGIIRKRSLA